MKQKEKVKKQYKIKDETEIKDFFNDKTVVNTYIKNRFREPIGLLKHNIQAEFINHAIRAHKIKEVLEIACGPARITTDIKGIGSGVASDYNKNMISAAKQRLTDKRWKITLLDAFNIRLKKQFDLVFSLRFIRHFNLKKREQLYKEIKKVLPKGKYLIFDVVNTPIGIKVKNFKKKKFTMYDELQTKKEIHAELEDNGFTAIIIKPVIKHIYVQYGVSQVAKALGLTRLGYGLVKIIEKVPGEPWEWIVLAKRKW